jgi:hypothetical protein
MYSYVKIIQKYRRDPDNDWVVMNRTLMEEVDQWKLS